MKTKTTFQNLATAVIALLLLTGFNAMAQTHVYNETTSSGIYFWPLSGSQVANPLPADPVNSTANCAVNSTAEAWSQIQFFPSPNYSPVSGDKLFFSIYSPNGAVKGKVSFRYPGGGWVGGVELVYTAATQTGWVEYSVDLSAHVGKVIDQVVFEPSTNAIAATYLDNVYFKNAPGPDFMYNEKYNMNIYFWPINGSQVANPIPADPLNSSANCVINNSADDWRQIQFFPYFKPVTGDKLFFSVYNPNNTASAQVKFVYDPWSDWQDGGNVTYTPASQTGWVEYSIALTPNIGNVIRNIILMPTGGASANVYVDNVYFAQTSTLSTNSFEVKKESIAFISSEGKIQFFKEQSNTNLTVFDLMGRLILNEKIDGKASANSLNTKGIYILKIETNAGVITQKSIYF